MPITLEDVRSVQWSQSFRWSVRFDPGPAGFDEWFPATEVSENVWSLNTYDFSAGNSTYSFPLETTEPTVEITFIDDVKLAIETWLTNWVNDILVGYDTSGVKRLPLCVKKLEVVKYNNLNEEIYSATYNVYPKGDMFFHGSSGPDPIIDTITFVVAEFIKVEHK